MTGRIGDKSASAIVGGGGVLGVVICTGTIGVLQIMSVISLAPLLLAGILTAAAILGVGYGLTAGCVALLVADKCAAKCNSGSYQSL